MFCLFGWLSGPAQGMPDVPPDLVQQSANGWTSIVTVVVVWLYSFGVTVVIALIYFVLQKWSWLDNFGRQSRSRRDRELEDIIGNLMKLSIEHEKDEGGDRYTIGSRANNEDASKEESQK